MGQRLDQRTALAAQPADGDLFHVVDVSDTTDNANGSSKKITYSNLVPDASTTVKGKVELATTDETTTGTDTTRAVTPDGLHDMTSLAGAAWFLDQDTMTDNSDTKVPSQQSVKAYADTKLSPTSTISQRINPRTTTETSSATPTINTDNTDIHTITALAAAITSFTTNLSGTPVNGQKLTIRIKDNGTARAITWGASFVSRGATLPTTTVLGKYVYVGFIYNSTASVWDCVAVSQEA